MITNDNIATAPGDIIIFQTVPMLNVNQINTYSDDVTGETLTRFFIRQFIYSLDGGITWAPVMDLNNTNLATLNSLLAQNYQQLVLQFRYTRSGTDSTGTLQINSVTVNGQFLPRGSVFTISGKGVFKDTVFNNINVLNLMINLAQKMYDEGISPAYLTRQTQETGFMDDEDYIDFWQTVAYFYAVITIDSIKFENIYWRRPLICEFLQERNVIICDCTDIVEMQLIAQNYYTEMRVRGTEEIFKPKGYQYQIGYRQAYNAPATYVLRPGTPVRIDGIVYTEVQNLPFGWTVEGLAFIGPDNNKHKVEFDFAGDGTFSSPPVSTTLVFPTANSGIFKLYNGEYLRLICYNGQCDEFIYNNVPSIYSGWCLANSSPIYKGLRPQRNPSLLKAYEKQAAVLDLTKYPLITPANIYIGIDTNPNNVIDTLMYISADKSPCFPGVMPQTGVLTKHLVVNIMSTTGQVDGVIKVTNTVTLDEFDIPVSATNKANFNILTDLVPGLYSFQFIFTYTGKAIFEADDGAANTQTFTDISVGNTNVAFNFPIVGSDTININLNFYN